MVLVFDVGATNTRVALVENGVLGDVTRLPTDRSAAGLGVFLDKLKEIAAGMPIRAVAGAAPFQFKGENGELDVATNLPEWDGLPFVAKLRKLFECPVYVANDAQMCGLGEAHYGAGSAKGVMVYYTVSTGVNGVRILDGAVDRTIARYEMGYQIVDFADGIPRSIESLAGGDSIEKRLGRPPKEVRDPEVWRQEERYLAAALYNTCLYWNPELIVLGGSMMRDIEIDRVREALESLPQIAESWPRLVRAKLGDEAGLLGAVAHLEKLGHK